MTVADQLQRVVWPWLIDEQPNNADTVAAIDSTPQLSSFLAYAHGAHS